MEQLEAKRTDVLKVIKPICEAFNIKDYDYEVKDYGQRETLRIGNTRIGCSCNSISAVIEELVGYIFIMTWRQRSMGSFENQTKSVIKRYWIK